MKIEVTVKPLAKIEAVVELGPGKYKVSLKEKPVEGRANEALCRILADYFRVSKSQVLLLRGLKGRIKRVEICGKD